MRVDIARARKLREEAEERAAGEVDIAHTLMRELVSNERRKHEAVVAELRRRQERELQQLREVLEHEKQQRAQGEAQMLHTIEQLCLRVRSEVGWNPNLHGMSPFCPLAHYEVHGLT